MVFIFPCVQTCKMDSSLQEKSSNGDNIKRGFLYGVITLIAVSFQPIIIRLSPEELDPLLYSFFLVIIEALLVLPIMIPESIKKRAKSEDNRNRNKLEFKRDLWRFIVIGGVFALAQVLFIFGFRNSDTITGSIAVKSAIIFMLIAGWIFLKERASKLQMFMTGIIIISLIFVLTEGSLTNIEISSGTIILLFVPLLWTIGHTLTKPLLLKDMIIPSQVIFLRTFIVAIFLFIAYFTTNPLDQFLLIFKPENIISVLLIAGTYVIGHYFWYSSIKHIDLAMATSIQAIQPILTSIMAALILQEIITIFQLVGLIFITGSIFVIFSDKFRISKMKDEMEKEKQ